MGLMFPEPHIGMADSISFRIVLQSPPPGVLFGIQEGKGNAYVVLQKQMSEKGNLVFQFSLPVKIGKTGSLELHGPIVQGPKGERFLYLDIGTYAGQKESIWGRRLKIPLSLIPHNLLNEAIANPQWVFATMIAGTGKDGGPNCGTVKPFSGWQLLKSVPFS